MPYSSTALGLVQIVQWVFWLYFLVVFVRVILSWMPLPSHHPFMRTVGPPVYAATEPLLAPIRRRMRPYMGGSPIDFSPLVLYLALIILQRIITTLILLAH